MVEEFQVIDGENEGKVVVVAMLLETFPLLSLRLIVVKDWFSQRVGVVARGNVVVDWFSYGVVMIGFLVCLYGKRKKCVWAREKCGKMVFWEKMEKDTG